MPFWKLRDARESLTCKDQIIVRKEYIEDTQTKSHYLIFSDPFSLLTAIENAGETVAFHEVTRTADQEWPLPQRLYFDIDAPADKWKHVDGHSFEKSTVDALLSAVSKTFGERFTGDFLVASSSNYIDKVSLHVTFPLLCFRQYESLKRAASVVTAQLPTQIAQTIDMLYKKNCCLRLLYSTKICTSRRKIPVGSGWPSDRALALACSTIHTYGLDTAKIVLYDNMFPYEALKACENTDESGLATYVLSLVEKKERSASLTKGGGAGNPPQGGAYVERSCKSLGDGKFALTLDRIAPSFCTMCARVHESDGCSIFVVEGSVYLKCMRTVGISGSKSTCLFKPAKIRSAPANPTTHNVQTHREHSEHVFDDTLELWEEELSNRGSAQPMHDEYLMLDDEDPCISICPYFEEILNV